METKSAELFGHLLYAESLTYDELLDAEERIIQDIEFLLERAGAEHIDFFPLGDALTFQCAFAKYKQYVFRKIACDLVEILPKGISGRIYGLAHTLENAVLYWVQPNIWQEASITFPVEAPKYVKVWHSEDGKIEDI